MEKLRKKGTKRDREKEMKIEKKRVREEGERVRKHVGTERGREKGKKWSEINLLATVE